MMKQYIWLTIMAEKYLKIKFLKDRISLTVHLNVRQKGMIPDMALKHQHERSFGCLSRNGERYVKFSKLF